MNTLAGRTAQARHLYDFLLSLSGRFCLSGQHNSIGTGDRYTCLVQQRTGRRPLVWGSDFSFAVSGSISTYLLTLRGSGATAGAGDSAQ